MRELMGTTKEKAARPTIGTSGMSICSVAYADEEITSEDKTRQRGRPAQTLSGLALRGDRRPEQSILDAVAECLREIESSQRGSAVSRAGEGVTKLSGRRCAWGRHRAADIRSVNQAHPSVPPPPRPSGPGEGEGSERPTLHDPTRRVALWRARDRRRLWPRGFGPRHLAQRRGPLGRRPGQVAQGFSTPEGLGRPVHRGIGLRPGRPGKGGGAARRRIGGGHERRQHQHPDRAHRTRDLQDPQRGGPHLRPPTSRDLPASGHPHRGHRHVDHRPGAAPPAARRGCRPMVRRNGAPESHRPLAPRVVGRHARYATWRSQAASTSWR